MHTYIHTYTHTYSPTNNMRMHIFNTISLKQLFLQCLQMWLDSGSQMIHNKIANKMQQCITIYYFMFIYGSMCFGLHTAHHRERNCTSSLWFCICEGCWTLWLLAADSGQQPQRPTTFTYAKPEAASAVALPMIGGVSPETH
jgi:hypothetical protein